MKSITIKKAGRYELRLSHEVGWTSFDVTVYVTSQDPNGVSYLEKVGVYTNYCDNTEDETMVAELLKELVLKP